MNVVGKLSVLKKNPQERERVTCLDVTCVTAAPHPFQLQLGGWS